MSDSLRRNQYYLGDVSPVPWMTPQKWFVAALCGVGAVMNLWLIVYTSNLLLILVEIVVCFILIALLSRDGRNGRWAEITFGQPFRQFLAKRAGWDEFVQNGHDRPFGVEHLQVVGWSPPGDDEREIGFVVSQRGGQISLILEVEGDGEGIRSAAEHITLERVLPAVLRHIANPTVALDRMQVITRVVPLEGLAYRRWQDAEMARGCPPGLERLRESMDQLARESETAHEIRSWLVLEMPMEGLFKEARSHGLNLRDPETRFVAAGGVGAGLARALEAEGIPVLKSLTAAEIGALVRAMWLPHHSPDDTTLTGESFWTAWPHYEACADGEGLWAQDPGTGEQWWHCSGSFPRQGWPPGPVLGRWLEPLILKAETPFRTIVTTFECLDKDRSRHLMRGQATTARAKRQTRRRRGVTTGGEDEMAETAANQVLHDVSTRGEVGVVTTVRVSCAAKDQLGLARGREGIEHATKSWMAGQMWVWDDGRHVPAMMQVLPLGERIETC